MNAAKEIITIGYKVVLSTKTEIPFDQDELVKVMQAISSGISVMLRKGLFNPSYYAAVIEDEKRRFDFLEDTKYDPQARERGMRKLEDIFSERKLLPGIRPDGTLAITAGAR